MDYVISLCTKLEQQPKQSDFDIQTYAVLLYISNDVNMIIDIATVMFTTPNFVRLQKLTSVFTTFLLDLQ